MKLIIDIPEELYEEIKCDEASGLHELTKAIANGIPLDKIVAEIKQLPTTKCTEIRRIYIDADDFKEDILAIFDKYKAESEG